jgi:hypothetical protein
MKLGDIVSEDIETFIIEKLTTSMRKAIHLNTVKAIYL